MIFQEEIFEVSLEIFWINFRYSSINCLKKSLKVLLEKALELFLENTSEGIPEDFFGDVLIS